MNNFSIAANLEEILQQVLNSNQMQKVEEGRFRETFRLGNFVVKKLKPYVTTKVAKLMKVTLPTSFYTKFKFGEDDFNKYEYENYLDLINQIPSNIRDSFYDIYGVINYANSSFSIGEAIINYDGEISKTLEQFGKIPAGEFWDRLEEMKQSFLEKRIDCFDFAPYNIMVKKDSSISHIPVLVDYKRIGRRRNPFQIALIGRRSIDEEIRVRFTRLKNRFFINSEAEEHSEILAD